MTRDLVVVGAGGFGRETLDVVEAINEVSATPRYRVVGVVDDTPSVVNRQRLAARHVLHCGGVDDYLASGSPDVLFVLAVGQPRARRGLVARFERAGHEAATLVHPAATIGSVARMAPGVVVCAGAQVSTNVHLGRHVHLNPNATVGHDSVLEDFVSVNPAATISGECLVGAGALVGAASTVLQRLTVGPGSVIGAAACVVRDVPADAIVKGVPAR